MYFYKKTACRMNIVEQNKTNIENICKSHEVEKLYVFGSAVSGNLKPTSDIDLLVKFGKVDLYNYFDNYLDFKELLEKLLNRTVDLVEEQTVKNPILKKSIDRNKRLIYG